MKTSKLKRVKRNAGDEIGTFAAQHSTYAQTAVYIPISESNDNAGWHHVSRNVDINLLEVWLTAEHGFDARHLRHAYRCRDLWATMPAPSWRVVETEGYRHAKASATLAKLKRSVPRSDWDAFENALRFNEPGGYVGSRLISPRPSDIAATKLTVKRVLEALPR